MSKKELGIYIHIPFCKQKCYYCDFISFANKNKKVDEYIQAIKSEINCHNFKDYNVTTIYIGGGTPSYIDSKYIVEILKQLKKKVIEECNKKFDEIEVTIEVNPGTVDREKLQQFKENGVNRLSIGLQSTKDRLLKEIGRIHTYNDFLETYKVAGEVGFDNINVDLMLGLPNQSLGDLKESIDEIIKLNPNHISVYSLIVEEGTLIANLLEEGKLKLPSEDLERNMYWYIKNRLELQGYKHYEISNFAKIGKESKHNMNCWEQKDYIGIGLAAHSYLNGIRYSNTTDLEEYIENMEMLENPMNEILKESKIYEIHERQSTDDMKKEYMLIGLRKIDGIEIRKFKEKFGDNPIFIFRKELERLSSEGLIQIDGDYIRLSNKGLDFANEVWEEFV